MIGMVLPAPALDHLVVAARSLPEGVARLEARLGFALTRGGEHPLFGTHNALLSLGETSYLEVVAVDPDASAPDRPRWFGLDDADMRLRLEQGPALIHWVVRVPALRREWQAHHGEALGLSRGDFSWQITVPASGELPGGGLLPSLIVWDGAHPTDRLADPGVRLDGLTLTTPAADRLRLQLDDLGIAAPIQVRSGTTGLRADLRTPNGPVSLDDL